MPLDDMRFPGPGVELPVGERIDAAALRAQYAAEDAVPPPEEAPKVLPPLPMVQTESGGFVCETDPGEAGYESVRPRGSVSPNEAMILSSLASKRNVIEIGTGLGVSTLAMAMTAKRVDTIDVDPWVVAEVFPRVTRLRPNVTCHVNDAALPVPCDMVFIDGNHCQESVERDIACALRWVRPGGLIVLHDYRIESVREACHVDAFRVDTEYELALIPVPL